MAGRAKHSQRSHKTYSNNTYAFIGFQRNALTKKKRMEANDNKATLIERIQAVFNRIRYRKSEGK